MLKGKRQVVYVMLITAIFFYRCEKEVSSDDLVERNDLKYEVNSETPFSGKSIEYYSGGEVKRESISYKDGLRQGTAKQWFESGQLKSEKSYKDGRLDGSFKTWFENGQISSEDSYKDGLADGVFKLWRENGQQLAETSWKADKVDGQAKFWYKNGQMRSEESYVDDERQGLKRVWYENGQQQFEGTFKDGKLEGKIQEWHKNGTLKAEGNCLEGQKVGTWSNWNQNGKPVVLDIDGNEYETVIIGDQVWMKDNLKVTHFRNGDPITRPTSNYFWKYSNKANYCYYDNDDGKSDNFGALYNWYALKDSRNIAPEGWHIPTDGEWKQLEIFLGMSEEETNESEGPGRGSNVGAKLKTTNIWSKDDDGLQNGTNESGFSAIPAGMRTSQGDFLYEGFYGYYWCASEERGKYAWYRSLMNWYPTISRDYADKECGMSVRCVKD